MVAEGHQKPKKDTSQTTTPSAGGYNPGHPWYFLLGGRILFPSEIKASVIARGYRSYMQDEIAKIANRPEPRRSRELEKLRVDFVRDLRRDISRYRGLACQLRRMREEHPLTEIPIACDDIHTAMSLKHNHIFNDFAHLIEIDRHSMQQGDLFDLYDCR